MDGRRRTGAGGQNCDGALLMARPLSGHAHPVRRQQAPPQARADRSDLRHISQLHYGSDHDLRRHVRDHHGQNTTWGLYTPILTVALNDRPSRPVLPARPEASLYVRLLGFPGCWTALSLLGVRRGRFPPQCNSAHPTTDPCRPRPGRYCGVRKSWLPTPGGGSLATPIYPD
jgi:hypothetical protein